MKPPFGAESMEKIADQMIHDPVWAMRYLWFKKTGQPPLPFDEFRPGELAAFLVGIDKVLEEEPAPAVGLSPRRWGPPRKLKQPKDWTEPVKTGDPLIDKWERELAAGRTPDLSEGLRS